MRYSLVSVFLMPLAVVAGALCRPRSFCSINSALIAELKDNPEASPFCASFISISTVQSTQTITVTPTPLNSIDPITVTASALTTIQTLTPRLSLDIETITETVVKTSTTTTFLTTSTTTASCLNSAYNAKPSTVTFKRRYQSDGNPPYFPGDWDSYQTSLACSCLSLQSPTTTVTHYETLTPGVAVVTSTHFFTPIVDVTETPVTPVITSTSLFTTTLTIVSTATETAYATTDPEYTVETIIATPGMSYRKYTHSFDADTTNSGFTASYFKTINYDFQGNLQSPYFSTPFWPYGGSYLYLSDGNNFDASWAALLFNGFFVAKESGTYEFSSSGDSIDNWGYLWVGSAAYQWTDSNAAFMASRTGTDAFFGGSYSIDMNKGDAVPITWLWANGGGPGQSDLTITTPSNLVIQGGSDNFAPPCSAQVFWSED